MVMYRLAGCDYLIGHNIDAWGYDGTFFQCDSLQSMMEWALYIRR